MNNLNCDSVPTACPCFAFVYFFLLFLTAFKDRVQCVLKWVDLGRGEERQIEIVRVKTLSFNILNEMCWSFSANIILKGNSLSVGKIF